MNRRTGAERRETLAERVATTRSREAAQDRPPTPTQRARSSPPPLKHAWYDGPHGRQAALLLEWRNIQGRFDGRICVAVPEEGGWAIVEMWVEAAMLSPA